MQTMSSESVELQGDGRSDDTGSMSATGARRRAIYLPSDEVTIPQDLPSGAYELGGATHLPRRFAVHDAELRVRGPKKRHIAIALREEAKDPGSDRRTLILAIWKNRWSEEPLRAARYALTQDGAEPSPAVHVAAYLTWGTELRCLDGVKATGGRIVLTTLTRHHAVGAFDLTFLGQRFHGTFLATYRSRQNKEQDKETESPPG